MFTYTFRISQLLYNGSLWDTFETNAIVEETVKQVVHPSSPGFVGRPILYNDVANQKESDNDKDDDDDDDDEKSGDLGEKKNYGEK